MEFSQNYLKMKQNEFYESGEAKIRESMDGLITEFRNWLDRLEVPYDMNFNENYKIFVIKEWE